jgi:hypothetical protein
MWQLQGFGKGPQYTNVIYPFPVDPPHVPYDGNETGTYTRTFKVPGDFKDHQLRLRFEGVDSSYDVWVNGKHVGYSEGSRNPSEFDISTYVHPDEENTLTVQVYQWCTGSYIEDQVSTDLRNEIAVESRNHNKISLRSCANFFPVGSMVAEWNISRCKLAGIPQGLY